MGFLPVRRRRRWLVDRVLTGAHVVTASEGVRCRIAGKNDYRSSPRVFGVRPPHERVFSRLAETRVSRLRKEPAMNLLRHFFACSLLLTLSWTASLAEDSMNRTLLFDVFLDGKKIGYRHVVGFYALTLLLIYMVAYIFQGGLTRYAE